MTKLLALILACLALGLAACGGDDDSSGGGGSGGQPADERREGGGTSVSLENIQFNPKT